MMEKETEEGNKLIAEFMAIQKEADMSREYFLLPNMATETRTGWYQIDGMKYHESWNWLMPVVEKINKAILEMDGEDQLYVSNMNIGQYSIFVSIDKLYSAVIEFVKWYNTNKPDWSNAHEV